MNYNDFFDSTNDGTVSVNRGANTVTFTIEEMYQAFLGRLRMDLMVNKPYLNEKGIARRRKNRTQDLSKQ